MVTSTADLLGLQAAMVFSRKSRHSRSCPRESPTLLSKWEARAWSMEFV